MKGFSIKKIFALLALTSLLTSSVFAEDFLAKLTKGALSDTSPGVKELSLEEMKEVKGGYLVRFKFFKDRPNLISEVYAIADFQNTNLAILTRIYVVQEKINVKILVETDYLLGCKSVRIPLLIIVLYIR